jgi:hypothetical protein
VATAMIIATKPPSIKPAADMAVKPTTTESNGSSK